MGPATSSQPCQIIMSIEASRSSRLKSVSDRDLVPGKSHQTKGEAVAQWAVANVSSIRSISITFLFKYQQLRVLLDNMDFSAVTASRLAFSTFNAVDGMIKLILSSDHSLFSPLERLKGFTESAGGVLERSRLLAQMLRSVVKIMLDFPIEIINLLLLSSPFGKVSVSFLLARKANDSTSRIHLSMLLNSCRLKGMLPL